MQQCPRLFRGIPAVRHRSVAISTPLSPWLVVAHLQRHDCFSTTAFRRNASSSYPPSSLTNLLQEESNTHFVLKSSSTDPFLNLSIEHHLLQKSHPDSTILFLYANRPCVVIGRNQNPWQETNLNLLRTRRTHSEEEIQGNAQKGVLENVELVRRRSGGGTVFHDAGNLNYCVICPRDDFTRDKAADMIAAALNEEKTSPTTEIRVSPRHDIVIDVPENGAMQTFKVSGSAYKLVRTRALHHGTLLLASPNIGDIGKYLRSPARDMITALGVESVRSPVRNLEAHLPSGEIGWLSETVGKGFAGMHGIDWEVVGSRNERTEAEGFVVHQGAGASNIVVGTVGDEQIELPQIRAGVDELQSLEWKYLQTPRFTFTADNQSLPTSLPSTTKISLSFKHGAITEASISFSEDETLAQAEINAFSARLVGVKLHEIGDWKGVLRGEDEDEGLVELEYVDGLAEWLNGVLRC